MRWCQKIDKCQVWFLLSLQSPSDGPSEWFLILYSIAKSSPAYCKKKSMRMIFQRHRLKPPFGLFDVIAKFREDGSAIICFLDPFWTASNIWWRFVQLFNNDTLPHQMVYHQNRVENEIYVINGSAQGQEMQMPYLDIREIRRRPPGGMKNWDSASGVCATEMSPLKALQQMHLFPNALSS